MEQDLTFEHIQKHFKGFDIKYIIGESFDNLKQSIEAIALSNILVFGNGGFAFFIHGMYSKYPLETAVYHISDLKKVKQVSEIPVVARHSNIILTNTILPVFPSCLSFKKYFPL